MRRVEILALLTTVACSRSVGLDEGDSDGPDDLGDASDLPAPTECGVTTLDGSGATFDVDGDVVAPDVLQCWVDSTGQDPKDSIAFVCGPESATSAAAAAWTATLAYNAEFSSVLPRFDGSPQRFTVRRSAVGIEGGEAVVDWMTVVDASGSLVFALAVASSEYPFGAALLEVPPEVVDLRFEMPAQPCGAQEIGCTGLGTPGSVVVDYQGESTMIDAYNGGSLGPYDVQVDMVVFAENTGRWLCDFPMPSLQFVIFRR